MRKKSMNDLFRQLLNIRKSDREDFVRAYSAYKKAFEQHFGCLPQSDAACELVRLFGMDYKC